MAEERSWRTEMDNPFLGSWDIPEGQESMVVEFTSIKYTEKIPELQGANKFLATIKGQKKKMVLNTTNMKRLEKQFGTDKKSGWLNQEVTIGVEMVRQVGTNDETPSLRVMVAKAAPRKEPIKPDQWQHAVKAAKSSPETKANILATRELTKEQRDELEAI